MTLDASDTSAVFQFDTSPVTQQGPQTMLIAGAIKSNNDSMTLSTWQATFYYAASVLAVASTTPGEGESLDTAPTEIMIAFSAPIVATSLSTDDLILNEGEVTSATQVDSQTIAFGVADLTEAGLVTYTLIAGAVQDAYGTPGPAYSGGFNVNAPTIHCYASGGVPLMIPTGATIDSTLVVPDALTVTDLEVQLDMAHTWDGNLTASLVAPDGTQVQLFSDVGGCGQNFTGTVLDDSAAIPITSGNPPFTGHYQPTFHLAQMDGLEAQGTWTLEVTDASESDVGTLYDWALVIGAGIQGVPPILRINQQYETATAGVDLSLPQIGTFSHPYSQSPFTYQIDWNDGTVDTGTATIVSTGSPGDYTIGTIGGDHTYTEAGTYYAEVTVSDAEGNSLPDDAGRRERTRSGVSRRWQPAECRPGQAAFASFKRAGRDGQRHRFPAPLGRRPGGQPGWRARHNHGQSGPLGCRAPGP